MNKVYLDYAATTPTHPDVVKAMLPYFTDNFGNPSSIYASGQNTKDAVGSARKNVADFIGARSEEIVFTSGGTEADNLALEGIAFANERKGNHIITSAIEHHAVLNTCKFLEDRGFEVTYLPVNEFGIVDPNDVFNAITSKTILISIMYANNEIGTIEPIAEIGQISKQAGVCFHTDAVQAVGHIPIEVDSLGVDLLSMSAHKLYGPKGIGALYVKKGTKIIPLLHGGEQEAGRRASTENVPGIVGFGKAIEIAQLEMDQEAIRLTKLRDKLIEQIMEQIDHTHLNGQRLPNNVNISIEYAEGESLCLLLDMQGIYAATGSACSSSQLEASHVLLAIGLSHELAHSSLRFSMGKWSSEQDIERVLEVLPPIVAKLRAMSPLSNK
jgi:cysteine desulfurase